MHNLFLQIYFTTSIKSIFKVINNKLLNQKIKNKQKYMQKDVGRNLGIVNNTYFLKHVAEFEANKENNEPYE